MRSIRVPQCRFLERFSRSTGIGIEAVVQGENYPSSYARSSSVSATRLSRGRPIVATASVFPASEYVTLQFFAAGEGPPQTAPVGPRVAERAGVGGPDPAPGADPPLQARGLRGGNCGVLADILTSLEP